MKSYGITQQNYYVDKIELHVESLKIKGFSIEESFFDQNTCDKLSNLLEEIYKIQSNEFGVENLTKINELDIARMPFLYKSEFMDVFMNPFILKVCELMIGEKFQLHLQNGIINRGKLEHHQTSWHRDLPYQDWVISKPLGFNAFICLSDFNSENGATILLPYSHKLDFFPSNTFIEKNWEQLLAPKGSILFFDSMLYHRASINKTDEVRYGLNNMFVSPILKQQVNIPSAYGDSTHLTQQQKSILGYEFQIPNDVFDFRNKRFFKNE